MAAPVVQINQATGLTNITTSESTTNFAGFRHSGGGTPTPGLDTDIFIQGSGAISIKTSGSSRDEGIWFDYGTAVGTIDLTTNANKHVYVWASCTTMSQMNNIQGGGMYVIIGSSTADWNKYYVGGANTQGGGWVRYVIDVTKTPSITAATAATLTAVKWIGIGVKAASVSAKSDNVILDRIDVGTGLQIESGDATDPANWEALYAADNSSSNKYGIVEKRSGVYFVKGGIQIGDKTASGATTLWKETTNSTVVFENPTYFAGFAFASAIDAPNLYKIDITGNDTGTTDVTWGSLIGTGTGRQGVSGGSIRSAGPKYEIDAETDIADLDSVNFYGVQFQGAGNIKLSGSTKCDVIGCTFANCGEVQPNDADWVNNTIVAPKPDRGVEMIAEGSHSIDLTTFVHSVEDSIDADLVFQVDISGSPDYRDQTTAFNGGAGSVNYFATPDAVGDWAAFGCRCRFAQLSLTNSTAGVGGVVVWEYWNGSAWAALPNLVDNTSSLSNTTAATVDYRVPSDWARTSLAGSDTFFWIRCRITTVFTTDPVGDEGAINRPVEHMVHVPGTGARSFSGLKFFGSGDRKYHVECSAAATSVDTYAFTNRDSLQALGNGTIDGVAQSFAGTAGVLSRVRFHLSKTGSPTGSVLCRLYAHSGSYGTSSIPTGAKLAESNSIDVSTLLTTVLEYDFEFEDEYTLAAATNYCVALEYTGGDGSNYVNVGYDGSTPSHGGNKSTLTTSTWSAQSGHDCTFQVWRDGIVTVNASDGANPTTDDNTATNPGAIIIDNTVTVKVTAKDAADLTTINGVRVLLEADTGGDLPANDTVTITRSGTEATVSHTAHGMLVGTKASIRDANEPEYNGVRTITSVSTNSWTYTVSGSPDSPATGTIKCSAVILDGTTAGGGILQDTAFPFTNDQPVTGVLRKGTATPYYKSVPTTGTITSSGLNVSVFMSGDE